MVRHIILLLLVGCAFSPYMALAQLSVSNNYTPTQLVENVLLGGGVVVSNVSYTGSPLARGYFNGANSNIDIEEGVILSTGTIVNAVGPNNDSGGDPMDNDFGYPGDATLTSISGYDTYDAAILEFDFIPQADTVSFRYIFASEEYMEYVDLGVNDAFGFFISGPGITGTLNLAQIPGTNIPVTIDDLNQVSYGQYYVDNGTGQSTPHNSDSYYVQYDGFTKVLEAKTVVTPCETYHIRLAIADAGDGVWDSGVFLEAGSFSSGTINLTSYATFSTTLNDTALLEGCGEAVITFERTGSTDYPTTIHFTIGGSATNGVDYDALPDSITLAAGQSTATLSLVPIMDGDNEGTEYFIVTADIGNPCLGTTETTISLSITDPPALTLSVYGDTTLYCPHEVEIGVIASGGLGYYQYNWDHGIGNTPEISAYTDTTTTYVVTVTDTCGSQVVVGSVSVSVPEYERIKVHVNDVIICAGDEALLIANHTGGIGPYTYEWQDNLGFDDSLSIAPATSSSYHVMVTDSCNASQSGSGKVTVLKGHADFTFEYTNNHAFQFKDASIDAVSYYWDFGDGTYSDEVNPHHDYGDSGTFWVMLTIINTDGCSDTVIKPVKAYPDFKVYIPNAFTPGQNRINDYFFAKGEGFIRHKMEIYDRWGAMIYTAESKREPWRGLTPDGKEIPMGVYVYIFEFETPLGEIIRRTGHVTLIR